MKANPTYAGFKNLSLNIVNDLGSHRLNTFQSGGRAPNGRYPLFI